LVNGRANLDLGTRTPIRFYVTAPANGSGPNWTLRLRVRAIEDDRGAEHRHQRLPARAVPWRQRGPRGTSHQIMQYYQTVAGGTHRLPSTGRWTGVGSRLSQCVRLYEPDRYRPRSTSRRTSRSTTHRGPIPEQDRPAQALADWTSLFNQLLSAHSTDACHRCGPLARLRSDQLGYQRHGRRAGL